MFNTLAVVGDHGAGGEEFNKGLTRIFTESEADEEPRKQKKAAFVGGLADQMTLGIKEQCHFRSLDYSSLRTTEERRGPLYSSD